MHKKAQVTIFVILGIIIIVLLIIGLSFFKKTELEIPAETGQDVNYFLRTCSENSFKEGLLESSSTGFINEQILVFNGEEYGFFMKDEFIYFKNKSEVEEIIVKKSNDFLIACLNDFNELKEQGYEANLREVSSAVELNQETIIITFLIDAEVSFQETSFNIEQQVSIINYPLFKYYQLLEEFMIQQALEMDYFQIGYLVELLHENEVSYVISYAGDETIAIKLKFPHNNRFNDEVILRFALK